MILHVYDLAVKSGVGEVLVATPDKIISDLIINNGGKSFISQNIHQTGTDRVYEAFKNFYSSKPKNIKTNNMNFRLINFIIKYTTQKSLYKRGILILKNKLFFLINRNSFVYI